MKKPLVTGIANKQFFINKIIKYFETKNKSCRFSLWIYNVIMKTSRRNILLSSLALASTGVALGSCKGGTPIPTKCPLLILHDLWESSKLK